jgi:hypothetical protein
MDCMIAEYDDNANEGGCYCIIDSKIGKGCKNFEDIRHAKDLTLAQYEKIKKR